MNYWHSLRNRSVNMEDQFYRQGFWGGSVVCLHFCVCVCGGGGGGKLMGKLCGRGQGNSTVFLGAVRPPDPYRRHHLHTLMRLSLLHRAQLSLLRTLHGVVARMVALLGGSSIKPSLTGVADFLPLQVHQLPRHPVFPGDAG